MACTLKRGTQEHNVNWAAAVHRLSTCDQDGGHGHNNSQGSPPRSCGSNYTIHTYAVLCSGRLIGQVSPYKVGGGVSGRMGVPGH